MTFQSRTDPFLFYVCTISSFLESRAATYVENLEPFFTCDSETQAWLQEIWLPEEMEHGRLMRAYVEAVWPEFDWEKGYQDFSELYVPQCTHEKLRASVSLEALARCVTETEAAMFYCCVGSYAQDEELRALLKRMFIDEVRHYRYFRDLHHLREACEGNSFLRRSRTLIARSELVRDEDVALAFEPLNSAWREPPPFPAWNYAEFLQSAARVMREHFPFEEARRMLFRPLKTGSLLEGAAVAVMTRLVSRQIMRYA